MTGHKAASANAESHPTSDQEFHALSGQILRHADRGMSKAEFVQKIAMLLARFSRCDEVEACLKDHESCLHARADQTRRLTLSRKAEELMPLENGGNIRSPTFVSDPAYPSALVVPVVADRRQVGYVLLRSRRSNHFPDGSIGLYAELSRSLALAVVHVKIREDLQERIKELTCLYNIARIAAQPDAWLEEVLQRVAETLPPAWLYPDIAVARIVYDGRTYGSADYRGGESSQRADIVIDGKRRGVIELAYLEERPHLDEGPFLKEERRLLDTIAEEVAAVISRREAERQKLRLEDQLRHADRLATLGQLAADVAHELNEPLGSVVGFAQLAKKSADLPAQAGRDIDKVLAASLQAREIVRRLLTFTRQTPPRKMRIALNDFVQESLKFFESRCAKEDVKLVISFSPSSPEVEADPTQLNQVFVNLFVNALQAMPHGGTLRVSTGWRQGHASLVIEDSGAGMDREVLKNIFTPFFTTKDIGEGTGLGLPVAYGIVTSHGGTLRITSRLGEGTKCVVRLPAGRGPVNPGHGGNG